MLLVMMTSMSLVMVLFFHLFLIEGLERSFFWLRTTETSELLANFIHEGCQVDVFIFIHLITLNEGSWYHLEIVFSVARVVLLSTH